MHIDSRRIARIRTSNVVTAFRHTIFLLSFDRSSIRHYYFARRANPVKSPSQNGRARKCLP